MCLESEVEHRILCSMQVLIEALSVSNKLKFPLLTVLFSIRAKIVHIRSPIISLATSHNTLKNAFVREPLE